MMQTINFSSNPGDSSNRVKKNLTLSDYVKMLGINTVDYYPKRRLLKLMGNMIKWIRNNIVKVHVSVILLCVVAFGFYGVHVRQYRMYKEYNSMKGVVTAVFKTKTCYMINARLDNGVCGSVNVGYDSYEVGDVYINSVHYDRIIGATGNAYYIYPHQIRY